MIRNRVAAANCLGEDDGSGGGNGGGDGGTPNLTSNGGELAVLGSIITVTQSIANIGNETAGTSKIGYFLSSDDNFSTTADFFIGSSSVPSIEASTNSPLVSFTQDVNELSVPAGDYFVIYFIDYEDVVTEGNENDNLFYWSDQIVTVGDNGGDTGTNYCTSAGNDASYEWISNVQIGDFKF